MFFGARITSGLQDWQVLQRRNGAAAVQLKGEWCLEPGAQRVGVSKRTVRVRCTRQIDQKPVSHWIPADTMDDGTWSVDFSLPEGGPYLVETTLDAVSSQTGDHWLFRGDIRTHVAVGDLFCIAGQSNAAGYGSGEAADPPNMMVRLQRNDGHWDLATHPFNDATGAPDSPNAPMGICGTGPFLAFGRAYYRRHKVAVGFLQTAQGGQPIARWDPRQDGSLLDNMVKKIQNAGGVRAVFWYQGCSDAAPGLAENYAEAFALVVNTLRGRLGEALPVFTFQLNRYVGCQFDESWGLVKDSQLKAAQSLPGVWIQPTNGVPLSDMIHNSSSSNVTLGERLEQQVSSAFFGLDDYRAPWPREARLTAGEIILKVDNAGGGLRFDGIGEEAGNFYVRDSLGVNPVVTAFCRDGLVVISTQRPISGKAWLSYAYACDPAGAFLVDSTTGLPLLSFYQMEVS